MTVFFSRGLPGLDSPLIEDFAREGTVDVV